ncbi:MAG: GAF domain-containing protein [Lachnospirales bacterium]
MIDLLEGIDVKTSYKYMVSTIEDVCKTEKNIGATLSNITAILNYYIKDINWVGFYLVDKENQNQLVLSYFQGNVACMRINFGKGVCGSAIANNEKYIVDNVHSFKGHIACDSATNSEIVIPINVNGEKYGVLDVDSPIESRFTNDEDEALCKVVKIIENYLSDKI